MIPLPWELSRQLLTLLESRASDDTIVKWADQTRCQLKSSHSELDRLLDLISAMTLARETRLDRLELKHIAQRMQDIPLEGDHLVDVLKETPEGYVPLKWTTQNLPPTSELRVLCMRCMCGFDPHICNRCDCGAVTIELDAAVVSDAEAQNVRFLVPRSPC